MTDASLPLIDPMPAVCSHVVTSDFCSISAGQRHERLENACHQLMVIFRQPDGNLNAHGFDGQAAAAGVGLTADHGVRFLQRAACLIVIIVKGIVGGGGV